MAYKYFQPNKLDIKDKHGDCAIRALCKVTGLDWDQAFLALVPYSLKYQSVTNDKVIMEAFLLDHGFTYVGISNAKGSTRPTVASFSRKEKTPCILNVAKHFVATMDGHYYDTWDCGKKSLYGYWMKVDDIAFEPSPIEDDLALRMVATSQEVAPLLGISERGVRYNCEQGNYTCRQAGKVWLIAKNSLKPSKAQRRQVADSLPTVKKANKHKVVRANTAPKDSRG